MPVLIRPRVVAWTGEIPAMLFPLKGESIPDLSGKTFIQRNVDHSYGSSEMIGQHVPGWVATGDPLDLSSVTYMWPYTKMVGGPSPWGYPFRSYYRTAKNWYLEVGVSSYGGTSLTFLYYDESGYAYPEKSYRSMSIAGSHGFYFSYGKVDVPKTISDFSDEEIEEYCMNLRNSRSDWISATFNGSSYDERLKLPDGKTYNLSYLMYSDPKYSIWSYPTPSNLTQFNEHFGLSGLDYTDESPALWEAYSNAVDNLPKDEMNWVEAVLDVVQLLVAVITANVVEVEHSLMGLAKVVSSGWLSYRYAITTTISDVDDIRTCRSRLAKLRALLKRQQTIKTHGLSTSSGAVVRVDLEVDISHVLQLSTFAGYTERMLAYDAWDLVPFSFIVDWFFGVGDLIHDDSLHSIAMKLKPSSAWVSYSYPVTDVDGRTIKRYFRKRLTYIPSQPSYSYYVVGETKPALSVKRGADALSIIIGLL